MIRPYRATDTADLIIAWRRASELAHPFLSEEFLEQEAVLLAERFLPASQTAVAEHEGRVVGFISVVGDEIGGLFVDPAFHGEGFGWALLQYARQGKGALELEVFEANPIGRAFYARAGFVEVGRVSDEATGLPALRLRLDPP